MRISLKQKIVSTIIALVLIVAVTCAIFLKTIVHNALENEVDRRAIAIARHFAELSADASLTDSTSLLKTHIRDYIASDSYLAYIVILQDHGKVQAHSFNGEPPSLVMEAIRNHNPDTTSYYFTGPDGNKTEDFYIPVGTGRDGAVHIGVHEHNIDQEVNTLLGRLTPTLAMLLLLGAIAAFILSSIITRHISVLMSGVSRVTTGDLDVVIDVKSHDEIGECAQAFNTMAERLRSTMVSRGFMEKLINTMNDVLVVISPDGVIRSVNQTFCGLFGYEEAQVIWHSVDEFGEDEPPARMFAAFRNAQQDGRYHGIESSCRTSRGDVLPMLFSLAIMKDDAGAPQAIICAAQDISDLKQVQDALRRKQGELEEVNRNLEEIVSSRTAELAITNEGLRAEVAERQRTTEELRSARDAAESASKAKSEFLANMSHEMRTPLNSIIGGTDFFEGTGMTSDQQKCLAMIRQAGDSLLVLVNDLIDLSRIEAGHLEIIIREFNLSQTLDGIISMLGQDAGRKQLELSLKTPANMPTHVKGDQARLQQVLVNLISNAIKFTDNRGSVSVSVLANNSTQDTAELTFIVRDTGIGVASEKLNMIFDTFAQADASITRRYGGSGLGLAISKRLVEAMGGQIQVESIPGVGSSFSFTMRMPLAAAAIHPQAAVQSPARPAPLTISVDTPPAELPRVLLVDDSTENRDLIRLLLNKLPVQLEEAGNGREALEMFEKNRYALILMDIQMPVMDGFTATRMIRRLEEHKQLGHTIIVALTAHAYETDIRKCLEAGCDDHVAKPFKKKTLLDCLTHYITEIPV